MNQMANRIGMGCLALFAGVACVANGAGYIPEPKPVKSCVEVTAVYYPGTDWMSEWDMVKQVYPHIRPTLGWYDEGHPENIDWQIKWAVEHGVTSFLVDWYWCKGVQRLDHWVKAFPRAKFAKHFRWYLNWCNHNEPGAHTVADMENVSKWWIDHYFKTDSYYKDEQGRPLVVIWEWTNLERDFRKIVGKADMRAGEGLKHALDITRRLAKEAGLPGVRFACFANGGRPKPEQMAALKLAGIEEMFQYNFAWPNQVRAGLSPERCKEWDANPQWWKSPWHYDFVWSREASMGWWKKNWVAGDIPFWPTLPTGWNSTPRDFGVANYVTKRTPEEFRKVCEDAKRFCAETGCRRIVIGPLNEWQEGSYIEPNDEYGFALYDALREVLCEKPAAGWPENLTPASIGRPNPQFAPMPFYARTSWDFSDGHQGWYRNPYGTQTIWPHDGEIEFFRTCAKRTPVAIRTRVKAFDAAKFTCFKVRLRLKPNLGRGKIGEPKGDEVVRLMWGRVGKPILREAGADKPLVFVADVSAQSSVKAILDGEWHEYTLPLKGNPDWNGQVDDLWFDPSDLLYVNAEIDWMKFE